MIKPIKEFVVDHLRVQVFRDPKQMGTAAAQAVSERIFNLHKVQADIRMFFAAAPSQDEYLDALAGIESNPWSSITAAKIM